jgi:hypothetical protein
MAILLLAAGCKLAIPKKNTRNPEDSQAQIAAKPSPPAPPVVAKDTASEEQGFLWEPIISDTLIKIEGKPFRLKLEAQPDTADKLTWTETFTDEGELRKEDYAGINCIYTISLSDVQGKKIFSRRLSKMDFWDRVYKGIVIASDPDIPAFLGYTKHFKSLLFTLDFMLPESDWGTQCFFMLDLQGGLKEISESNNFGGGDIDCEPTVSGNGKAILTCNKILNARGRSVDLYREDRETILARFLTDTTVLVIYDYDPAKNPKNAVVLKTNGTAVTKFTYRGYYNVLGYVVPLYFLPETNSVYLLDERRAQLHVLSNRDPKKIVRHSFKEMAPFKGTQKRSEIKFEMETEESGHIFYLDRQTRRFRYQKLLTL